MIDPSQAGGMPPMPIGGPPAPPAPPAQTAPQDQPLRSLGPFSRMNKNLESMATSQTQQAEALQAVMHMLADLHKTMTAFMALSGQIGEMIQRSTAQSQAESARLMAALTAEKEISLHPDSTGRMMGATVRPAMPPMQQ